MMTHRHSLPAQVGALLRAGVVVPAHPLALDERRRLDPVRQRALTRYYLDAGAGGIAVGVHMTQFGIREHDLYEPVLRLAAETAADWTDRPVLLVAGVTGTTPQAVDEARLARSLGYHAALLNVAALRDLPERDILRHCRLLAMEIPLIGFSLQPKAGGMHLSYDFWRAFAEIEDVVAIKMAPFDRHRTLDIVRAVVDAGAQDRITLYTGNDDHIVLDLLAPFLVRQADGREHSVRIRGGLLGHWSVWTRRAVELFETIHALDGQDAVPLRLLALDSVVTDCNGALFDAVNDFAGCAPGCLEVLRRQGLLRGTWCLDPHERLSCGQLVEIDRVCAVHADMTDDAFVTANLERWLSDRGAAISLVA